MKAYIFSICVGIVLISCMNSQTIVYVVRVRNFTIISDDVKILNSTIYRKDMEHRVAMKLNVTKDMDLKSAHATLYRCAYEKTDCEYCQNWTLPTSSSLKNFYNMRMWKPMTKGFKPPLNSFPLIRKNVYECTGWNTDGNAAIAFYPDAINYYYRAEVTYFYSHKKKAATIWTEVGVHSFVKRNRTRNRGNSAKEH